MFFDKPTSLTWEEAAEVLPGVDLPVGVEFVPSSDMTRAEKKENPTHTAIGGYLREHMLPLQESFPIAWSKMSKRERDKWKSLPNFDAKKFYQITGVDVRVPK